MQAESEGEVVHHLEEDEEKAGRHSTRSILSVITAINHDVIDLNVQIWEEKANYAEFGEKEKVLFMTCTKPGATFEGVVFRFWL